ncbi:unnamed protein product [Mycena citricolor]|uniref:Uncharacterized protein n=1 Tax=Mycena citricolor TaxID=2018698 RepID=A0AAD2HFJ2_9AGAR|nr:unnamed protein product [Mycena citricolor]
MAGLLSGHLVNAYEASGSRMNRSASSPIVTMGMNTKTRSSAPSHQQPQSASSSTHNVASAATSPRPADMTMHHDLTASTSMAGDGLMSFDSDMHGHGRFSTSDFGGGPDDGGFAGGGFGGGEYGGGGPPPNTHTFSASTYDRLSLLQTKLNQKLGPEYISTRPGPSGGPKLTYAEGWKIINVANEVFGFSGWSSSIRSLQTDYVDWNAETRRCSAGVTCVMRVTLREGVWHEDVGYGLIDNAKGRGVALDKCKKEAVTDALKRTLRTFGNLTGNCLYDKNYTAEVNKIKPVPVKFDQDDLYRPPVRVKPEPLPQPVKPNATSTPARPIPVPPQAQAPPSAHAHARPQAHIPAHGQGQAHTPVQAQAQGPARAPANPMVAAQDVKPEDTTYDEGFEFDDDDEFLSRVDLGDADFGRPIEYDEGNSVLSAGGGAKEEIPSPVPPQVAMPPPPLPQPQPAHHGPMGLGRTGSVAPPPKFNRERAIATLNQASASRVGDPSNSTSTVRNTPAVKRPTSGGQFTFPPGMQNPLKRGPEALA